MREDGRVPTLPEISSLFQMLLGRDVDVLPARKPAKLTKAKHFFAAVYLDERRHVTGLMMCDAQFAVRAGAALSLFPAHKVDALAAAGEVDETFRENLGEVLNVATQFFHGSFETNSTLAKVFEVPDEAPAQLFQLVEMAEKRRDYHVAIQGYGDGRVTLIYV
jgi:hypothetical protein